MGSIEYSIVKEKHISNSYIVCKQYRIYTIWHMTIMIIFISYKYKHTILLEFVRVGCSVSARLKLFRSGDNSRGQTNWHFGEALNPQIWVLLSCIGAKLLIPFTRISCLIIFWIDRTISLLMVHSCEQTLHWAAGRAYWAGGNEEATRSPAGLWDQPPSPPLVHWTVWSESASCCFSLRILA